MRSHTLTFVLAFFSACAAAQAREPVRSLLEMRQENVVIQKWDVSCGAAALATILHYQHGDPVDEKSVAEGMLRRTDPLRVKFRGGFSLLDLKRYADSRGLTARAYLSVQLDDLERFGAAIVPVDFRGYPHFVVFRGRIGNSILLADPAFGNRVVDVQRFERAWQQNIAFVVSRTDGSPAPHTLGIRAADFVSAPAPTLRQLVR